VEQGRDRLIVARPLPPADRERLAIEPAGLAEARRVLAVNRERVEGERDLAGWERAARDDEGAAKGRERRAVVPASDVGEPELAQQRRPERRELLGATTSDRAERPREERDRFAVRSAPRALARAQEELLGGNRARSDQRSSRSDAQAAP
jgi:hypothetical protein